MTWGQGIQHMGEGMPNAHASLNRLDIVKRHTAKGVSMLKERMLKQAYSHGQLSLNQALLILVKIIKYRRSGNFAVKIFLLVYGSDKN